MNEPRRFVDDLDADPELARLIRAAPVPRAMSADERARSARSLGRLAALPAAAGTLFWFKNVALAAALGAAGGVVVATGVPALTESPAPALAPIEIPSPAPEHAPPSGNAAPAEPAPAPSAAMPPSKRTLPAAPPPSASGDSLAREAELLESARKVLGSDPSRALAILERHARELPRGKLASERELMTVDALMRLGREGEARARAEKALARAPGGLYEERLRKLLGER